MEARQASVASGHRGGSAGSLFEDGPAGFPAAHVAGPVANLLLFIPGEPVPTDRPRARVVTPKGRAPFVQFYSVKKSSDYQDHVGAWAMQQIRSIPVVPGQEFKLPFTMCRLLVTLRFNMEKPVSYPKRIVDHTRKPDADNLSKGVLDGLVKGNVITDDSAVTDLTILKRYSSWDHPTGVEIDLTAIPTEV